MQLRDRFVFDPEESILFIDLAGLRIETRDQVDETRQAAREILESRGRRAYAIVNYEGAEIAPKIVDYYGAKLTSATLAQGSRWDDRAAAERRQSGTTFVIKLPLG